jgi:hypothetical protein
MGQRTNGESLLKTINIQAVKKTLNVKLEFDVYAYYAGTR